MYALARLARVLARQTAREIVKARPSMYPALERGLRTHRGSRRWVSFGKMGGDRVKERATTSDQPKPEQPIFHTVKETATYLRLCQKQVRG